MTSAVGLNYGSSLVSAGALGRLPVELALGAVIPAGTCHLAEEYREEVVGSTDRDLLTARHDLDQADETARCSLAAQEPHHIRLGHGDKVRSARTTGVPRARAPPG